MLCRLAPCSMKVLCPNPWVPGPFSVVFACSPCVVSLWDLQLDLTGGVGDMRIGYTLT